MRRLVLVVVLLSGCSLGLDFGDEKEGRPCGSAGECLEGYVCRSGTCEKTDAETSDIGQACGAGRACAVGELCGTPDEGWPDGFCLKRCETVACPAGTHCAKVLQSGRACAPDCTSPAQCRTGYDCVDADGDGKRECFPGG